MPADERVQLLQTSEDPWELLDAAKSLARDKDEDGHAALAQAVCDERFLSHLDTEQDYEAGVSGDLRLVLVMKAVGDNAIASAIDVLAAASNSPTYLGHPFRIDALIDAWAEVRPSPPQAISFWERYSTIDDGFIERTLLQLSANGSDPALALLEKKLIDPKVDPNHRRYWIRRHAIPHRDNPAMLAAIQRMALGAIDPELRVNIVEIVFDYQPKAWYSPHDVPKLPSRALAKDPALKQILDIAEIAKAKLQLPPDLSAKVDAEVQIIKQRLGEEPPKS